MSPPSPPAVPTTGSASVPPRAPDEHAARSASAFTSALTSSLTPAPAPAPSQESVPQSRRSTASIHAEAAGPPQWVPVPELAGGPPLPSSDWGARHPPARDRTLPAEGSRAPWGRQSLALPSEQEAAEAAARSAAILLDLMAYQRTFDGAYKRTALAELSYALLVLKLFHHSFYYIGVVSVALALLLAIAAWNRSNLGRENVYRMARSDAPAPWWEPVADQLHALLDRSLYRYWDQDRQEQQMDEQPGQQRGDGDHSPTSTGTDVLAAEQGTRTCLPSPTAQPHARPAPVGRSAPGAVHRRSYNAPSPREPVTETDTGAGPRRRFSLQDVLSVPAQLVQSTLVLRTPAQLRPFAEHGSAPAFSFSVPGARKGGAAVPGRAGAEEEEGLRRYRRQLLWDRARLRARAVAWDSVRPALHGVSHFRTAGSVVASVALGTLVTQVAILVLVVRMD